MSNLGGGGGPGGFGGTGGGGGGGGGGGVPTPPAAGLLLTSTGSAAGDYDWEPPGGFLITSFTGGTLRELGNADVNPHVAAAYNETPDSANVTFPAAGSPLVLVTPFTAGTIPATFTSTVNGTTFTFTLSATKGSTTKTANTVDTFAYPFLFDVQTTGSIVATQGFLDTMRADQGAELHTAFAGRYPPSGTLNVGAGENFAIAWPTALGTPTITDNNGFTVSPTIVGTVAGYTNPFGVTIGMTLAIVGASGIGNAFFSLAP